MQDKTPYIDFIIDCLKSGIVERKDIMAKFGEKWQTPSRTFDRYLQKANEAYKLEREAINELKTKEYTESELEAVKTQIITREKFIESLESEIFDIEKIIKKGYILKDLTIEGKKERVKEFFKTYELAQWHKILNDKRDRLAKIQGFDAPIEQNTTVTIKDKPKVEDWVLSKSNKIENNQKK